MSFIENLYLRDQVLKLQESNQNLKTILKQLHEVKLQRYRAFNHEIRAYQRLPRKPYPGQHPAYWDGQYTTSPYVYQPWVDQYPHGIEPTNPYPGQHPVGRSTVNEAAQVTKMIASPTEVPDTSTSPNPNKIPVPYNPYTPEEMHKINQQFYDHFVDELDKCLSGVYNCDQQTIDSLIDRIRFYAERLRGTGY